MIIRGNDPAEVLRSLERTIRLIARHPPYPGREEALNLCREDIEERYHEGILTDEERTRLLSILSEEDGPE